MPTIRNDLPDNTRKAMIELLNARLADAVDLRLSIKEAHWNVKGPTFIALHELFDQIQARVDTFTDDIAERAVALAGIAEGTLQSATKSTNLPPFPTNLSAGAEVTKAVADRLAAFDKLARAAINTAD